MADENAARAATEIEDDRLRLIFTCCHPAIDPKLQVPLTLREVCGLTTEEIAHAFLTSKATMAQRIVRGKAKIRDAQIPYVVPSLGDLPERLDAVLSAIYLVFNEGYAASQGASLIRVDLTAEAIRLGRLLLELLPDPGASPSVETVWCVHAPGRHFGHSCPGRLGRPDGLESDYRALLRTAANRFLTGRRAQSGGRGRDAGRTGSGS